MVTVNWVHDRYVTPQCNASEKAGTDVGLAVCRPRQMYVYHGQDRDTRPSFLAEQDIVVTTYATLAADLNSCTGLLKARAHLWGRLEASECCQS